MYVSGGLLSIIGFAFLTYIDHKNSSQIHEYHGNNLSLITTGELDVAIYLHSVHVKSALVPFSFQDHVIGGREGLIPSCFVHFPGQG